MRTSHLSLPGALCLLVTAVLPLRVVAQTDEPGDMTSEPPGEVSTVPEVVYATGRAPDEATELKLLVIVAGSEVAGSEDAPLVVDVGGSTWDPWSLAERGVSVFRIRYPEDQFGPVMSFADPTAVRKMVEAVACAVRFARGSEYGSETAPLVLTGWSVDGGPAAHVALAGESFDRVWDEYAESRGGPPAQYDCTVGEASTRVDGFVGVAGGYDDFVGIEGKYGRDFLLEHEPDLWRTLWGTVGLHPELRVRLIHGGSDTTIPLELSSAFKDALAETGHDVELIEVAGAGHDIAQDVVFRHLLELLE